MRANTGITLRRNWSRGQFWAGNTGWKNGPGAAVWGEVWKAFDTIGERDVALKFVPKDVQRYEHEMQRVKETFKAVHALNHQYICPVYALEEAPVHGFYLVMKWLDGYTLDEAYKHIECDGNRLPIQYVPQLLECVAEALDYAHNHGVVHRDIKPTNIFVNIQNEKVAEVNLIDFGLASEIRESMTRVSQVQFNTSGTRPYMPPEQWRGRKQDARTDQYSLAVVAYELYAGNLPFSGADFDMLRAAVMNDMPEKINAIPDTINAALQKALSKDGVDRFTTCVEFIDALKGKETQNVAISSVPAPQQSTPPPLPSSKPTNTGAPGTANQAVNVNELQKTAFETNDEWLRRIIAAKYIEIGHADFRLQESNPEQGIYPVVLTVNLFCQGRSIRLIPPKITLILSPKIAGEIFSRTPQIPMTGMVTPLDNGWALTKLRLQSGDWQFDLSAEIERLEEEERQRIEGIQKQQEKERREKEEEQERERRSWIEANAGDRKTLNIKGVEYAFHWCPPGEFMMGSAVKSGFWGWLGGGFSDETEHNVCLTKGFWMLETPVTQAMWENVMENNPSKFEGANHPVEEVSWTEANEFCKKLNQLATTGTFSLPTEAQWEYACRAGTTGEYGGTGNLDEMGWCRENSGSKTHEVKTKRPNAWGLYDMHGNVLEWCLDWYGDYPTVSVTDPTGPNTDSNRVIRGGCCFSDAGDCRSAKRNYFSPEDRSRGLGFRLVLNLSSE